MVGVEADFTAFSGMGGSGTMPWDGRHETKNNIYYSVFSKGDAEAELKDVALFKIRGAVPFGTFMPYGTIGLAIGYQQLKANYYSTFSEYTLDYQGYPSNLLSSGDANAFINKTGYVAGLAGGIGADWAILPNLFLRAEYQYIVFSPFKGMETNVNMVRAGIGFKY